MNEAQVAEALWDARVEGRTLELGLPDRPSSPEDAYALLRRQEALRVALQTDLVVELSANPVEVWVLLPGQRPLGEADPLVRHLQRRVRLRADALQVLGACLLRVEQ